MPSSLNHVIMKNPFFLFLICLSVFLSCEKEELTLPPAEILTVEWQDKAVIDCSFDEATNRVHLVEYCGTDYFFHISLALSNHGKFHRVQAYAKCYKRGGDPGNYVDFGKIEIEVAGNMHIGCGIPIDIQVPSDYNKNLVFGQVPFRSQCEDCGISVVTLDYFKPVSMIKPQDVIKANFRLKLEDCDVRVEKLFTLQI